MSADDRDYSNGEITVHWRPDLCTHCENCVKGLPEVFDANRRPWVSLAYVPSSEITAQVDKCPSGALTWSEVQ